MSIYSTQRQNKATSEPSAAQRRGSNPGQDASPTPECPVLLRVPDVSRVSVENNVDQTTPESDESDPPGLDTAQVSQPVGTPDAEQPGLMQAPALNPKEQAFASLLAASPAFHNTIQTTADIANRGTAKSGTAKSGTAKSGTAKSDIVTDDMLPDDNPSLNYPVVPSRQEVPEGSEASGGATQQPTVPRTSPVVSAPRNTAPGRATNDHPTDKPTTLPVRRSFRVYRPVWMPDVPPTLLLGALICCTALLIGMLWRSNQAEYREIARPADQEKSQPTPSKSESASASHIAEVPSRPKLSPETAEQPLKTAGRKPTPDGSLKLSETSVSEPSARGTGPSAELANRNSAYPTTNNQTTPDIHALPPVESDRQDNFYGQMLGGPPPHIVHNPHVGDSRQAGPTGPGQDTLYQARRPATEFRGMITKPDATDNHERY